MYKVNSNDHYPLPNKNKDKSVHRYAKKGEKREREKKCCGDYGILLGIPSLPKVHHARRLPKIVTYCIITLKSMTNRDTAYLKGNIHNG